MVYDWETQLYLEVGHWSILEHIGDFMGIRRGAGAVSEVVVGS